MPSPVTVQTRGRVRGTISDTSSASQQDGVAGDREDRILAQGVAYVRFALARPGRFGLMWRTALLDFNDQTLDSASRRAFLALDRLVRGDVAPLPPSHPACTPSVACWSIVHGFATLALGGAFGSGPDAAERAAEQMLPAVIGCLRV